MTLTTLQPGQNVMVEVSFGESKIQFESTVLGSDGVGVYITPYIFKDTVIDFKALKYANLLYNIYTLDENGMRQVFKSVEVEIKRFKGADRYLVKSRGFLKFSQISERRQNSRLALNDVKGTVAKKDGPELNCIVNDISDTGISFFCNEGRFTTADQLQLYFFDYAKDQPFDVDILVRIVRVVRKPEGFLYAGRIVLGQKDVLGYICLKRMEYRAQELVKMRKFNH